MRPSRSQVSKLYLIAGPQAELEARVALAQPARHGRDMQTQDELRSPEPQLRTFLVAQLTGERGQTCEERLDVGEKFAPCRGQPKRTALEKPRPKVRFQSAHLTADRRLLDPIRDVAHRGADAAMLRHIVEQLEVMHVHGAEMKLSTFPAAKQRPFP